jgi:hypothetical protein
MALEEWAKFLAHFERENVHDPRYVRFIDHQSWFTANGENSDAVVSVVSPRLPFSSRLHTRPEAKRFTHSRSYTYAQTA